MICVHEMFSGFIEIGLVGIVLGDDTTIMVVGCGTISFRGDPCDSMVVRDVFYVPRLKKKLISVSMSKARGLVVLFQDGHVLVYPKGVSDTIVVVIGVHCGKIHNLTFYPMYALTHNVRSIIIDLCEIWNTRMDELHHPTLRMLRENVTSFPQFICHKPKKNLLFF